MQSMRNLLVSTLIAAPAALLLGCGQGTNDSTASSGSLDYNWDVKPILSDNCFRCHGADAGAREAGLRLDMAESAYAELSESPGNFAIMPGDPDASELVWRITAPNPDDRMPPQHTHKTLTEDDIETLRAWIEQGAQYKPHWAFVPPQRAAAPVTGFDDRARNDIDRYILARLEDAGLSPSAEADRETLINRVSLTLTGLPPTLEAVDAFVADEDPDAYENLVDRLLASEAYGEQMAGYWMNLARWAETDGYLDDHHDRFLWPWRDWVIQAFNDNMPYDRFGTWQLAGDLLPDASREQILATAFLRLNRRNNENGAIDEEWIMEYMVDRTDTLGNAFLAMTAGCARCHDHKYDPISQRDYYAMGAFFHQMDEPGFYSSGWSAIQAGPTLPLIDPAEHPELIEADGVLADRISDWETARQAVTPAADSRAATLLAGPRDELADEVQAAIDAATVAYYPFDETEPFDVDRMPPPQPPGSAPTQLVKLERFSRTNLPQNVDEELSTDAGGEESGGGEDDFGAGPDPRIPNGFIADRLAFTPSGLPDAQPALLEAPILGDGVRGQAIHFDTTNKGLIPREVGWRERTEPFSFDLWFHTGERFDYHVPILDNRDDENASGTGYRVYLNDGRVWWFLTHSRPANSIAIRTADQLPEREWVHITGTYDGSSRAAGTRLYINGEPAEVEIDHDTLTRTILPMSYGAIVDPYVGLRIGTRFRVKSPEGMAMDEFRFFDNELTPLEVAYLHDGPAALDSEAAVVSEFLVANDPSVQAAFAAVTEAREARNQIVSLVPQILVARDQQVPRTTYVYERGVYTNPGEVVTPAGFDSIFEWDDSKPKNRIGLSEWLFDARNPLTARVFVNRMWQMHFGRGIVETSEDFGAQSSPPTHPELLDWLALEFIESGWDIKQLHKLIVMSGTYRQSSEASDESLAADPRNELLARGASWRMSSHMIRDNALAVSGLLVPEIGGPSVHPYQPEGIWNSQITFYSYPAADAVHPDEHHRRTIYTFVKRNALHPALTIFDAADPSVSVARTSVSNTPLQALALMNDPQYVEAYRELATNILTSSDDEQAQITRLLRLATRKTPTDEQVEILRDFYLDQHREFSAAPAKVAALLDVGVTPFDSEVDATEVAAMTNTAALAMNSPDAYTLR